MPEKCGGLYVRGIGGFLILRWGMLCSESVSLWARLAAGMDKIDLFGVRRLDVGKDSVAQLRSARDAQRTLRVKNGAIA